MHICVLYDILKYNGYQVAKKTGVAYADFE